MEKVLSKPTDNKVSILPTRITEIAVTNNLTPEVKEIVCLIKEWGEKGNVLNRKYINVPRAKVTIYSKSQAASQSFKRKLERGEILTVGIFETEVPGRDFNTTKTVVDFFELKGSSVFNVYKHDAEARNTDWTAQEHLIFGTTFGDTMEILSAKYAPTHNQNKALEEFSLKFKEKVLEIRECLTAFSTQKKALKVGLKSDLTLACVISEEHGNSAVMQHIAHSLKNADVLVYVHPEKTDNFISASPKAEKCLDVIIQELLSSEPTTWIRKGNVIYSCPKRLSSFTAEKLTEIAKRATANLVIVETPKATGNGTHMPSDATKHNGIESQPVSIEEKSSVREREMVAA